MYIVIETLGDWKYTTILTDENGNNRVFDTLDEAWKAADNNCQDGIVLGIGMTVTFDKT